MVPYGTWRLEQEGDSSINVFPHGSLVYFIEIFNSIVDLSLVHSYPKLSVVAFSRLTVIGPLISASSPLPPQ